MVIAGMMVTLVPPLFSGAVSGAKVKGAVRDFAIILRESRNKAIIHNIEQQVFLELDENRYRVGDDEHHELPETITMDVETVDGSVQQNIDKHKLVFFPDGSSSGELITVRGGNHVYHLQLDWLTGSLAISEGGDSAG